MASRPDARAAAAGSGAGSSRAGRRRWRWIARLALALGGVVAAALLFEVAMRVRARAQGHPFDAKRARMALSLALSQSQDFIPDLEREPDGAGSSAARGLSNVLHPYVGFDSVGGVDQLGQQLPRAAPGADAGDFEILVVGGSVAAMFCQLGAPRLIELLRADPRLRDRRIVVMPFGRGAYKQPQPTILVEYLLALGFTPEAVIAIDGFNEVAVGSENAAAGTHPLHPAITIWGGLALGGLTDRAAIDIASRARAHQESTRALADTALRWGFHRSLVLTKLTLRRLEAHLDGARTGFHEYTDRLRAISDELVVRGPAFDASPEAVAECTTRAWAQASRSLDAICRRRGIPYLHVLQPSALDVRGEPVPPEVRERSSANPLSRGVLHGYPLLRARGAELLADGECFLDATGVFDGEEPSPFFDTCHFGERGNVLLAERMAPAFLRALAQR